MFRLAHLSDLHATRVHFGVRELASVLGKRGMGWLSWRTHRRHEYRPEILALMMADLKRQRPDQVAITGDLTHLGLAAELEEAARQLRGLGDPETLTLIPGNHDAYRSLPGGDAWRGWEPYLAGDASVPDQFPEFPTLRVRGDIALVGLSSAQPTPWPLASGRLGEEQLDRLGVLLRDLGSRALCRVILVHHPPLRELASRRRCLVDAPALQDLVEREGAELVLHGHVHRTCFASLRGPRGPIPSVGVRSASALGSKRGRRAQYHLFRIERARQGFSIALEVRGLVPGEERVDRLAERRL